MDVLNYLWASEGKLNVAQNRAGLKKKKRRKMYFPYILNIYEYFTRETPVIPRGRCTLCVAGSFVKRHQNLHACEHAGLQPRG